MIRLSLLVLAFSVLTSCSKNQDPNPSNPLTSMYFPPNSGTTWETVSPSTLGWNQTAMQPLKEYLSLKYTKSFMILVNGRIAMEEYFDGHTPSSEWEWNSAGKTLVATTTGIAQQEGLLNITNKASDYLGTEWTNMPLAKENLITVRHLLTMTSGIDDSSPLVIKPNLTYVADAGTRWAYGNVFQKLMDVIGEASGKEFETYFNEKLKDKIGMDGFWNFGAVYSIYHSTTRSMARFGLLALNQGKWNSTEVINEPYFKESITTSQNINPSYGYLWWLNGKNSYMVPGSQIVFPGYLVPNAPADMYSAMGASDQRIYVIPSKKMVVIRMGNASDPAHPSFALSGFDNELWGKIKAVIN
ncbi:MAG: serine hydrolase [Sphingobacteriales bacterium]|nr:serine hydrolase [Sphingobacteriales bacterium]OJV99465.1 MAG: serine hydrolase [Sphingobacteriales bacterium 44-61]